MYRILLVFLLAGVAKYSSCADNLLISEDKIWEYVSRWVAENYAIDRYRFDGTQTLNGKTYHCWKRILHAEWHGEKYDGVIPDHASVQELDELDALMREEDGKVYMNLGDKWVRIYNSSNTTLGPYVLCNDHGEVVLYDFNLKKDDYYKGLVTAMWSDDAMGFFQDVISDIQITEEWTLNVCDREYPYYYCESSFIRQALRSWDDCRMVFYYPYRSIFLSGESDYPIYKEALETSYAQGLGNIGCGTMTRITTSEPVFMTAGWYPFNQYLTRVYDSAGEVIYKLGGTHTPASMRVPRLDPQSDNRLYDLMGREIRNPQPGTVYIRNGKKYVAK